MSSSSLRKHRRFAIVACSVGLAIVLIAGALATYSPDRYHLVVQEDDVLEWATFWAFIVAAILGIASARRQHLDSGRLPWFSVGIALFCLLVAFEEISWGQRLIAYRPPTYFLEHNFQQELNVHNLLDTKLRKLALKLVILGFGIALPVCARIKPLGTKLQQLGIVAPSILLTPIFAIAYGLYTWYPYRFSGEWVELLLGLGFLYASLATDSSKANPLRRPAGAITALLATGVIAVLGSGCAALSRAAIWSHPGNSDTARIEVEALARDFLSSRVKIGCDIHKRVYSFEQKYDQTNLQRGEFFRLTERGLPSERAAFYLDPWNSPYWVRRRCQGSRRSLFVYSFGPNRRRESDEWQVLGDDIGAPASSTPTTKK